MNAKFSTWCTALAAIVLVLSTVGTAFGGRNFGRSDRAARNSGSRRATEKVATGSTRAAAAAILSRGLRL